MNAYANFLSNLIQQAQNSYNNPLLDANHRAAMTGGLQGSIASVGEPTGNIPDYGKLGAWEGFLSLLPKTNY